MRHELTKRQALIPPVLRGAEAEDAVPVRLSRGGVEDLAAYLAGRDRVDAATRWGELQPAYQDLAANLS